jgi:hypothetical protein
MIDVFIDALTNSVIKRQTEEVFQTAITRVISKELDETISWNFNWKQEFRQSVVFKVTTLATPNTIEGLIRVEIRQGFVFVSLVENTPHNIGKNGVYAGVAGNLFAFACQLSLEKGYGGYVSFVAKTELIEHYKKMLSAEILFGKNMVIKEDAALNLIQKYFK